MRKYNYATDSHTFYINVGENIGVADAGDFHFQP